MSTTGLRVQGKGMSVPDWLLSERPIGPRDVARFWSKVEVTDGCWFWTGWLNKKGYGQFDIPGWKPRAHRLAYELMVGRILDGLQLDHLCRNRRCVRPDHLEPVTNRENSRRGDTGKHLRRSSASTLGETRDAIQAWRTRTGRTLHDLAEESGVGLPSVTAVAAGRRLPAAWIVNRIVEVVGR